MKDPLGDKADSKPAVTAPKKEEVTGAGEVVNTGNTDEESLSAIGEKNIADPAGGGDGSLPGAAPNTFIDAREVDDAHIAAAQNDDEIQLVKDSMKEQTSEPKTL